MSSALADAPRLSIVIATCAGSPGLLRITSLVRDQLDQSGLAGELIVVINDAVDSLPPAFVESAKALCDQLLFEETPGKSRALNLAVRRARADIVAFIDDDALPQPGWIAALIAPLLADPGLGGVGGRVIPVLPERGVPRWYRRMFRGRHSFFLGPLHDLGDRELDYGAGGFEALPFGTNCAYRRALLLEIGYDPELGPNRASGTRGGEDTLLARRLLDSGQRLRYQPSSIVNHPVSPTRITPSYVLEGYFWQGVERVRMQRALGVQVGWASHWKSRFAVLQSAPLAWIHSWLPGGLRVRLLKRRQRHRGMLAELGHCTSSVRPLATLLLAARFIDGA